MTFQYPSGPDDTSVPSYNRDQFAAVHKVHGTNDAGRLFGPSSPTTNTPWPTAPRTKGKPAYNRDLVDKELSGPAHTRSVDPRNLHASQPGIVRSHVEYYMGDEYHKTGKTSADQGSPGNQYPLVYHRQDGVNMLLAGHHRAAASLLQGKQFIARFVEE